MMMTMRGLKAAVVAAVLSTPSLVYGIDASSTATVSLPLEFHDQDGQLILTSFRLDIHESDQVCDPAKVTVYDQPILVTVDGHQDGWASGWSKLQMENGFYAPVAWEFACSTDVDGVLDQQTLSLTLTNDDGQPLHDAHFYTSFQQTAPVQVQWVSSPFPERVEVAQSGDDELWWNTKSGEPFPEVTAEQDHDWDSEREAEQRCKSWSCMVGSVAESVKEKAVHVYGDLMDKKFPWHGTSHNANQDAKRPSADDEGEQVHVDDKQFQIYGKHRKNQKMKPISSKSSSSTPSTTSSPAATRSLFPINSLPKPDQSLITSLTIAAAAFALFSLLSITILGHRHLTPHIQRRPRRGETREERLARVAERRRAVKKFFRALFCCGLFAFAEKDEASPPQGRDLRSGGREVEEEDDNTTMEQELARFREAASMVSNLIAAEEGRNQTMVQQHQREAPPAVPPSMQAPYQGYVAGDVSPPSYEFDSVEASLLADGFRYTRGETEYTPGSPVEGGDVENHDSNNSDRLGYGNKD